MSLMREKDLHCFRNALCLAIRLLSYSTRKSLYLLEP